MRLASYLRRQYKFSYLRTSDDVEIDLIIERPGEPTIYIEIKSTDHIQSTLLTYFKKKPMILKTLRQYVCQTILSLRNSIT